MFLSGEIQLHAQRRAAAFVPLEFPNLISTKLDKPLRFRIRFRVKKRFLRLLSTSGCSPRSIVPAGTSRRSVAIAYLNWRTKTTLRSWIIGTIAAAPRCSITSRVVVLPFPNITWSTRRFKIRPSYTRDEDVQRSISIQVSNSGREYERFAQGGIDAPNCSVWCLVLFLLKASYC